MRNMRILAGVLSVILLAMPILGYAYDGLLPEEYDALHEYVFTKEGVEWRVQFSEEQFNYPEGYRQRGDKLVVLPCILSRTKGGDCFAALFITCEHFNGVQIVDSFEALVGDVGFLIDVAESFHTESGQFILLGTEGNGLFREISKVGGIGEAALLCFLFTSAEHNHEEVELWLKDTQRYDLMAYIVRSMQERLSLSFPVADASHPQWTYDLVGQF